ncbi:MAG: hypothetical protein RR313_00105 [Anaerovoracaceae bacterium]
MVDFKTMEEIQTYLSSQKDTLSPSEYQDLSYLLGLLDNEGEYTLLDIKGISVKIDSSLVTLIRRLNEIGIETLSCCSGLETEHCGSKYFNHQGYLSLKWDAALYSRLLADSSKLGIVVEDSEAYLERAVTIRVMGSEADKIKQWVAVTAYLLE